MLTRNMNACFRELNSLYFVPTTCRYNLLCAYLHLEDTRTRYMGLWGENTEEIAAFMCYISKASYETFRSCDGFLLTYSPGSLPSAVRKKKKYDCVMWINSFSGNVTKKLKAPKKWSAFGIVYLSATVCLCFYFTQTTLFFFPRDCLTCFCLGLSSKIVTLQSFWPFNICLHILPQQQHQQHQQHRPVMRPWTEPPGTHRLV